MISFCRMVGSVGSCVGLVLVLTLVGCNNCEELTAKVCDELGDDCALWKEIGGPDDIMPKGRKPNKACGTTMDNELALGNGQGCRS